MFGFKKRLEKILILCFRKFGKPISCYSKLQRRRNVKSLGEWSVLFHPDSYGCPRRKKWLQNSVFVDSDAYWGHWYPKWCSSFHQSQRSGELRRSMGRFPAYPGEFLRYSQVFTCFSVPFLRQLIRLMVICSLPWDSVCFKVCSMPWQVQNLRRIHTKHGSVCFFTPGKNWHD